MDPIITIYHNPRCSKSRAACELIAARRIELKVIDYLTTPPTRDELRSLVKKLGIKPGELVRRGEVAFKENYEGHEISDEQWLAALIAHPILIERPIIVRGDRAVIGRPPEKVLEWLDSLDAAD